MVTQAGVEGYVGILCLGKERHSRQRDNMRHEKAGLVGKWQALRWE